MKGFSMAEYSPTDTMECLGICFTEETPDQMIGDCPFCDKEGHFMASKETGQWDCKACGEEGNLITLMTKLRKELCEATSPSRYKKLAKLRRIPLEALQNWNLSWVDREVLIPVESASGKVHNYRRWNPKKNIMKSLPGCELQLFGAYRVSRLSPESTIWLCEGEWDAIVMSHILKKIGLTSHQVAAVPGANTFKDEWVNLFKGHTVILCYDHDAAGEKGAIKAAGKLQGVAKKLQCIQWSENRPKGYDIRAHWIKLKKQKTPASIFKAFKRMIAPIGELKLFNTAIPDSDKKPVLTTLSEVEAEDVEWLWDNRIPMGKLSMIAGDPGLGKSFLTLYICSIVSRGDRFPDIESPIESGSAILLSAEDGLADTIRPRLDAAGADTSKIVAFQG
jgi:hypothetical protein